MDRMACVDLPAFPLQLLLRRHPEWSTHPVAVVESDRPQSVVLWTNERARESGVVTGMRYAAGLSLATGLRAATVPENEIRDEIASIAERLRQFTPNVESVLPGAPPPAPATRGRHRPGERPASPAGSHDSAGCHRFLLGEPGVFWLDARGLERLFGSLDEWAASVQADLVRAGYRATLVLGFSRFGAYALARSRRGVHVLKSPAEENKAARQVPLDRLALPPATRNALVKLGITTMGKFVDLPLDGVGARFGPEVRRLHRLASGDLAVPLQPARPDVPAMRRLVLDHPEDDAGRIVSSIETLIGPFLDEISHKARLLAELRVGFRFERMGDHLESIRPAAPTLDARLLLELIRLRLEAVRKLPDGVVEIVLVARETQATPREQELFAERKRRDLEAANRALARVRAQLGDAAVARVHLCDGHLPEARFAWEPLASLGEARPRPVDEARLVRRIHERPVPLPLRERHEPDGWMLRGLEQGPVVRTLGPYVLSGGWWNRPVHRDYHFAETKDGELLWVYYDRGRRRWFLQGRVE